MKRNITFLLIRLSVISMIFISLFLLIEHRHQWLFYPEAPARLSAFTNNQHIYLSLCPSLSTVTPVINNTTDKLPLPFTLLNWNIYKQQRKNWQARLQGWTEATDLITLQEAKYSFELQNFSRKNNLFYYQNNAFKYKGLVYGVNTLSRYPAQFICGSRDTEPWIQIPKTGLASSYQLANTSASLLLINLHGVNFTFRSALLAKQLQPYLDLIVLHQGPVIFSGDFNTWSDQRQKLLENALFKLSFNEVTFGNDQRITIFGHQLDHIYFRGLKVITSTSIETDASDHTPQLVTFDIESD